MIKKIILLTLLIAFIGLCVGVTGYLYVKEQKSKEFFATDSVFVADVIKKTVATGAIEPRREVNIKPQVSGYVEKLFVKAGDDVRKGEQIALIKIVPNVINLNTAETNVKTAKINFERAETEYQRRKQLHDDKVISNAEFLGFEQDYLLAKEQLEAAMSQLQLIKTGASNRIRQNNNVVRATIDGKILDIAVKEGAFVIESNTFNDGTTIATMANMSDLIFKGKIVESEVAKVKEGAELDLHVGALPETIYKAKLEFIASKGVEDKGAIQFEIKAGILPVINQKNHLKAGYSANAHIILEKRMQVPVVREKNIVTNSDSTYVWLETQPQVFEKRLVKTGLSDDLLIEILSGLKVGDKIKIMTNQ